MSGFKRLCIGLLIAALVVCGVADASEPARTGISATMHVTVLAVAALCAALMVVWGIEPLWDRLMRATKVASFLPRHLSTEDGASPAEHVAERALRHPERWAATANVTGTITLNERVRDDDGKSRRVTRIVDTFPRCRSVAMSALGPVGIFEVAQGTTPQQWSVERIATALGRNYCRVSVVDPRSVAVTVITRDPLAGPGPAPTGTPTGVVDLDAWRDSTFLGEDTTETGRLE